MKIVLYILISVFIAYITPFALFVSSLGKRKERLEDIRDNKLFSYIFEKTQVKLQSIKLLNSVKTFGMMLGIPKRPYMILSKGLYSKFTKGEIHYIVLHEAGHYLLNHSTRSLRAVILLIVIGVILLLTFPNLEIGWILILGAITGIIAIQINRRFEYEADKFTLERIEDPQIMIAATKKFERNNPLSCYLKIRGLNFLFVGVPYEKRILLAKQEILIRKDKKKTLEVN